MFRSTKPNLVLSEQITGWMTHDELTWLAKQSIKHQRIVEIGSYMGRTTRALGDNTPGIVYTIDNFLGPQDISLPKSMRENILETFVWGLGDLLTNKVVMVVSDHKTAEVPFSPDMVFIDGSHEYEAVKYDIQKWKSRLTPGGLLCGHDYTNIYPVRQAVDELLPKAKLAHGTSIWYSYI